MRCLLTSSVVVLCGVASAAGGEYTCAHARLTCGWCEACSTGFVATFPVTSAELYEVIHPHGHQVDPDKMLCPRCREAVRTDGWCPECHTGYLHGEAYFSRLTYVLVHGQPVDPASLKCAVCRRHTRRYGWCEACNVGWVGNVRFTSKSQFAEATEQMDIFFTAVEVAEECVYCASAMIMNSRCPVHRITYKDGEPVKAAERAPTGDAK